MGSLLIVAVYVGMTQSFTISINESDIIEVKFESTFHFLVWSKSRQPEFSSLRSQDVLMLDFEFTLGQSGVSIWTPISKSWSRSQVQSEK